MEYQEDVSAEGRRALIAAFFGFMVDMIDVYLPVTVLGPAMSYFEPKGLPAVTSTTLYYVVFALSLIGRPLGSIIFGHYGDKFGRRKTTLVAVAGASIVTFLIALLPGYTTWGLTGIILVAILRLIGGIFLGGEYTGATPLAMEYSPRKRRGMYGGFINSGYPVALVVIAVIMMVMFHIAPANGPTSPYAVWGWRIPFILGAIISFLLFLYYRRVPESKIWEQTSKAKAPLKELFHGESFRRLSVVFVVMSGVWFMLYAVVSMLPGIMTYIGVKGNVSNAASLWANIVLCFLFIPVGMLSQKIGRRAVLILFGVVGLTVVPYVYFQLVHHATNGSTFIVIMTVIVTGLTISVYGVLTAFITEMFETGVRASGYGIGYSLAVIVPSFTSFYMIFLKHFMAYEYTEIVIAAFGGLLILIGGLISPESRSAEFDATLNNYDA
ncbi:MFS transporter [Alicyclobacillus dauci]|uniref:MFS transporter n=1 Tax=Alicyclobacillus dauci TaxID=1475485 RepID=A0ABY6Z2K1_9BACL|nr:MFS transporter [Alicyclobacillus dauci]WAH37129.1 MFS transporter [Alicyclobacillus dauci]